MQALSVLPPSVPAPAPAARPAERRTIGAEAVPAVADQARRPWRQTVSDDARQAPFPLVGDGGEDAGLRLISLAPEAASNDNHFYGGHFHSGSAGGADVTASIWLMAQILGQTTEDLTPADHRAAGAYRQSGGGTAGDAAQPPLLDLTV